MTQSRILNQSPHYVACITSAGLTVQNKRTTKGVNLLPTGKDFCTWVNTFENALDSSEFNFLARSFIRGIA